MLERIFGTDNKIISQEIENNVKEGKRLVGQLQRGTDSLAQQIGSFRDQPCYLYQSGRWIRVTGKMSGLTEIEKMQSGFRPGQWSQMKASVRDVLVIGHFNRPVRTA